MTRYQYQTLTLDHSMTSMVQEELNRLGELGWRLLCAAETRNWVDFGEDDPEHLQTQRCLILMRERDD